MDRLALVMGNANYTFASALNNPINDARDIGDILRKLGFEVIEGLNLTLTETSEMVNSFLRDLDNYSTGLLFYAGHGMQIDGKNYIVPVDCKILDQSQTIFSCYCIDDYLSKLNVYKGKTNIIILDACRNNPFARGRGMISGFSEFHNTPRGTIIAFSTSPDCTASDGVGSNGLYTQVLKDAIQIPNMKIEEIFKAVRIKVSEISLNTFHEEQLSWEHSSLVGDFYFSVTPQPVNIEYSDEEIYAFVKERGDYYESETENIYDIECMPFVDAYKKFNLPIIRILRAYSRIQYKNKGTAFSDPTIDEINYHYINSWGFKMKNGRWYYRDNYVEMGDLLPLSEELSQPTPDSGCELKIGGRVKGELENGKARFTLWSNIPVDTPLIFSLRRKHYFAQCSVSVTEKFTVSDLFSNKGQALRNGHYRLQITCPIHNVLPESVKEVFGERNRNITGGFVSFDPIGGNTINMNYEFLIKDNEILAVE